MLVKWRGGNTEPERVKRMGNWASVERILEAGTAGKKGEKRAFWSTWDSLEGQSRSRGGEIYRSKKRERGKNYKGHRRKEQMRSPDRQFQ